MERVGAWSIALFGATISVHEDRTIFSVDSCESVDEDEGKAKDDREDEQDEDDPGCRVGTGLRLSEV